LFLQVRDTEANEAVPITAHEYNATLAFYFINLEQDLIAGKEYVITIDFVAPVSTNLLSGLYLAQFDQPGSPDIQLVNCTYESVLILKANLFSGVNDHNRF